MCRYVQVLTPDAPLISLPRARAQAGRDRWRSCRKWGLSRLVTASKIGFGSRARYGVCDARARVPLAGVIRLQSRVLWCSPARCSRPEGGLSGGRPPRPLAPRGHRDDRLRSQKHAHAGKGEDGQRRRRRTAGPALPATASVKAACASATLSAPASAASAEHYLHETSGLLLRRWRMPKRRKKTISKREGEALPLLLPQERLSRHQCPWHNA
jgi:hypothetical protein